jgi:hypothetical protein
MCRIIFQSDCLHVIETLQTGTFSSTAAAIYDHIYVHGLTFSSLVSVAGKQIVYRQRQIHAWMFGLAIR